MTALCMYAICRGARHARSFGGPAGERLWLVEAAGLAAVVGKAVASRASVPALQRYDALQRALMHEFDPILPVRFGTRVRDDDEAALILEARAASLRAALRRVRGRAQMTLRTVCERDATPPMPDERRALSGAAYLDARAVAAARERAVPAFEPVVAAVRRWTRAERFERHGSVASLFQLVPRSAAEAYAAAARLAAQKARVSVIVTGPFPAYAFAP